MGIPIWHDEADYVVVGSGAAGATAAMVLAEAGAEVLLIEEGKWYQREQFTEDVYGTMATLFRDFGMQVARGNGAVTLVLQGSCVGGSTVMNGAIVHRLPEQVHSQWCVDKGLAEAIPYDRIDACSDKIETDLGVGRNAEPYLERASVTTTLRKLGWSYQAMARNAPGCQFSRRCLQGCPSGGKLSMENSYIPRMLEAKGRLLTEYKAIKIKSIAGRITGLECRHEGLKRNIRARKAVLLAAGVLHTPLLLKKSGFGKTGSPIGKHFQCHLGIGIVGRFNREVHAIEGPPQGIEILGFKDSGIKLATQLTPPELVLARTPLVGEELAYFQKKADHFSGWTGSVQSEAEGAVTPTWMGGAGVKYAPSEQDLKRLRQSLWSLSELLFETGAEEVFPGVAGPEGIPSRIKKRSDIDRILKMPLDPRYYLTSMGHLFGTCRMGSDKNTSVVDTRFRVHGTDNLYVMDASLFPSNIGVNPQHAIMALAMLGTEKILENPYVS